MKKTRGVCLLTKFIYRLAALICLVFIFLSVQAEAVEKNSFPSDVVPLPVLSPKKASLALFQSESSRIENSGRESSVKSSPGFSGWKVFWFILNLFGMILAFIAAVLLAAKATGWLIEFGHSLKLSQTTWAALMVLLIIAPFFLLKFGYSEAAIANSWQSLSPPMRESGYFNSRAANLYQTDYAGRISYLRLSEANVPDLRQLDGIEKLTSLSEVEISRVASLPNDQAENDLIDLSVFENAPNLKVLQFNELDLSRVENLEKLPAITKLRLMHCKGISLELIAARQGIKELVLNGSEVSDLSALARLSELESLSIADTRVQSLAGLENLKLLRAIDIRGTIFTPQDVRNFFNRPIFIIAGDSAAIPQINPQAWQWLQAAGITILIFALLSFLPLTSVLRRRAVAVAQRLFRKMMFGLGLFWCVIFVAYLERPGAATGGVDSESRYWIILYGALWLSAWIVLRPAILLLLETKFVGSSPWSVSLKVVARVIPVLTFIFPFALLLITGAVMLIRNSSSLFSLIFLIPLIAAFGSVLSWITIILVPAFAARRRAKALKKLCAGEDDGADKVIEIPLSSAPGVVSLKPLLHRGVKYLFKLFKVQSSQSFELFSATSVATLQHAPVLPTVKNNFRGAWVLVAREHLANAREWELDALKNWIHSAYQHTAAPIWIIGDWFGQLQPSSIEMQRSLQTLTSVHPYISDFVRLPSVTNALTLNSVPSVISNCLNSNNLIDKDKLDELGLNFLFARAFTPVAGLMRNVFGQAELTDRLDTLFRAVEAAAAFWALVFVLEFEENIELPYTPKEEKIARGIIKTFKNERGENKPLVFSSWASLLNTFVNNYDSELMASFAESFNAQCYFSHTDLRKMLVNINEQAADFPEEIETRKQLLALLIALRNVTTAHGPATQAADPELYIQLFTGAFEFLAALPWDEVLLTAVSNDGKLISFAGCVPQIDDEEIDEQPGTFVLIRHEDPEKIQILDARRYFRADPETLSVAIYTGETNFLDLLFGTRREE